jgi:hypothetical protein
MIAAASMLGATHLFSHGVDEASLEIGLSTGNTGPYVDGVRRTCIRTTAAMARSLSRDLPAEKFETACNCVADGMAELVAQDDVKKYMADHHGALPPAAQNTVQSLTVQCSDSVFGKPG